MTSKNKRSKTFEVDVMGVVPKKFLYDDNAHQIGSIAALYKDYFHLRGESVH